MTRLAKCPQQHIWLPLGTDDASAVLTCPVCGQAGESLAMAPTPTTIFPSKLAATPVPAGASDEDSSGTIPISAAEDWPRAVVPTVPGYDILRELGRGGMGVVYLARHLKLKRLVALKMILAGAHAGPETLARFRREAEAVARLQHPGITQIHDIGQHDGRPYLALEFVDGSNLASQLAGATLAPRGAAALVETLARTIHYAHQRGVVHRDLTPRNILLAASTSAQGIRLFKADPQLYEPKITDFGLAKELDAHECQTETGMVMGTPSYMSPEQAQGRTHEIGPPTDIYALGAMLYQVLTGRPPYVGTTSFDTLKQVIESEPVLPTRLQPNVPVDLETICLKCLAKDRLKRYTSAEALADDLHRYLASEPIQARRVSWHERARKWARRRPALAALIAVVLLAVGLLTLGSIVYSVRVRGERDRAEHNFQLAMRAVDGMLTEVGDEQLAFEPRMEEKRKALLAKALELYQEFLQEKQRDPRVRHETAQAYRRMADVLRLLGQYDEAQGAYDQAVVLLARLIDEFPGNASYRQQMAYCQNMRGESLRIGGKLAEADVAYREAQAILEKTAGELPQDAVSSQELARTHYNRGILLRQLKQPDEAEKHFQQAIDSLVGRSQSPLHTPIEQQHLARAYLNLGTVIPSVSRFADAKDVYDRAIEILSDLSENIPANPDYRHELGVAHNNLGNLMLRANRPADAKAAYAQALERFESLARDFPKVPAYRQELANSLNSIGSVDARLQDFAAAKEAWQKAASLLEVLVEEHGENLGYRGDLAMVLANRGLAEYGQSRWAEARADFDESIEILTRVLASGPDQLHYRQVLRDDYQNLAEALLALNDHTAAARAARELAKVFGDNGHDQYLAACFLARCATMASRDDQLDVDQRDVIAQRYSDEAMLFLRGAIERGFRDREQIEKDRAQALQALAERADFQQIIATLDAAKPAQ